MNEQNPAYDLLSLFLQPTEMNSTQIISKQRFQELIVFINSLKLDSQTINLLNKNKTKNYRIINEALTHSSSNQKENYEKLEFKGDAVLRLIASEFIEKKYPEMSVGESSELRSQLVSDNWLANVGKEIGIQQIILIGSKALGDYSAKSTIQADATEALIGALYECLKTLEPLHKWLSPYWVKESNKVLSDPHKNNYKSALQEWSQSKGFFLPDYRTIEKCKQHGYSKRFFCSVHIQGKLLAKGWGGSRKDAEKDAAQNALKFIEQSNIDLL